MQNHTTAPRARVLAGATALTLGLGLAAGLPAAQAASPTARSSDAGLFGVQDPTYDGVYRQGLALIGLRAVERTAPASAVRWLLRQQCPDGAFAAYRPDTAANCPTPDVQTFSGKDTNSTSMAALALRAVSTDPGQRPGVRRASRVAAAQALVYLRARQQPDGGFPWIPGMSSDVNSTGLALAALRADRTRPAVRNALAHARGYLRDTQLDCSTTAANRGLFPYQGGATSPDSLASAQVAVGLVTGLPGRVGPRQRLTPLRCSGPSRATLPGSTLAALRRTLRANDGVLPASFGTDPDLSATSAAVVALTAARQPRAAAAAVARLRTAAPSFTTPAGDGVAGAYGSLLLVTAIRGGDPTSFGGVNLVAGLRATVRR